MVFGSRRYCYRKCPTSLQSMKTSLIKNWSGGTGPTGKLSFVLGESAYKNHFNASFIITGTEPASGSPLAQKEEQVQQVTYTARQDQVTYVTSQQDQNTQQLVAAKPHQVQRHVKPLALS